MTGPLQFACVAVPDEVARHPALGALLYTGLPAVEAAAMMPAGLDVAIDIETPSVTDSFSIKCVTASWESGGDTHCVLLDPLRRPVDAGALREIVKKARWLILHGAPFDIPGLVAAGLMTIGDIAKVMDTLLLARAAWPDTLDLKGLEALAPKMLGLSGMTGALAAAIKASGLGSKARWFREGDIDMPTYRRGAMSDTVVTLRLAYPLYEAAVSRQLDHPFSTYGATDRSAAGEIIDRLLRVNRVFLRRSARGYPVDLDYLDSYVDKVRAQQIAAHRTLEAAGCRPGVGLDVVTKIDEDGALPSNWPRTAKTNRLKSDKKAMELLPDHPLAVAHALAAHTAKVIGYMEKTVERAAVTGLLHPQWHVLGASATGRMSASEPELQQFPEEARPIILADPGRSFTSVDWTSIEPALLGWMSRDWGFIDPFESGADIYEPVQTAASITRKLAKVIVLAVLYGQGKASTAKALACSTDRADEIKHQMLRAMPECNRHMRVIKAIGREHGLVLTVAGRILTLPRINGVYLDHKAVNYTCQGSCADLLYHSVDLADQAGLGDYIALPLHDELVVDTEVADEIQRIMSTPPDTLIARAGGRVPVIRTDSQQLGAQWLAC